MAVALSVSVLLLVPANASPSVAPPTRGLVSFWDFQERSGPFVAKLGRGRYALEEKSYNPSTRVWSSNNKVQRVQDAPPARPFGEMSASIGVSQMLHVPDTYETAPLLNIHGDDATLTVVAWVKPSPALDNASHYDFGHLVGIWAEPISVRTYVMFVPASSRGRVQGQPEGQVPYLDAEISRTGATMQPLCRWSISYALGASPINHSSWHMLAMTFDGNAIRALVNGSLDVRPPDRPHRTPNFTQCTERWQNPAPISTWTNRSAGTWGPGGAPVSKNKADFTVGGQRGAPCLDGVQCSGMGHAWSGRIGGLAVYDRALEAAELHGLAQQTGMTPLR